MTDKERLGDFSRLPFRKRIELTKESIQKDLEASDYLFPKNVYINTKYILEIIEQAERVQELEEDLTKYRNGFEFQVLINNSIKKQNQRYREALEAIAYFDDKEEGEVATRIDAKYIARKALEDEE